MPGWNGNQAIINLKTGHLFINQFKRLVGDSLSVAVVRDFTVESVRIYSDVTDKP